MNHEHSLIGIPNEMGHTNKAYRILQTIFELFDLIVIIDFFFIVIKMAKTKRKQQQNSHKGIKIRQRISK